VPPDVAAPEPDVLPLLDPAPADPAPVDPAPLAPADPAPEPIVALASIHCPLAPADALSWLAKGWQDLTIQPRTSLSYGLLIFLTSVAIVGGLFRLGLDYILFPAFAGFMVVDYSPETAVVRILVRQATVAYVSVDYTVDWDGVDWKLRPLSTGGLYTEASPVLSLAGFVQWKET
jgi:hypothetical protein